MAKRRRTSPRSSRTAKTTMMQIPVTSSNTESISPASPFFERSSSYERDHWSGTRSFCR